MAVPLHRLNQNGDERPQPLAADPVRRLPDHDQRFPYSVVVDTASRSWCGLLVCPASPKNPHRVLAMEARNRRELVQDPAPLGTIPLRIPPRNRCYQLVTRRHADPPHLLSPPLTIGREQIR